MSVEIKSISSNYWLPRVMEFDEEQDWLRLKTILSSVARGSLNLLSTEDKLFAQALHDDMIAFDGKGKKNGR